MIDIPENVRRLKEAIRDCRLCPRDCRVDRTAGQIGSCRIGAEAVVASAGPHFGEEPVLVAHRGSGTIFLAGCNLHCVFCQNYDISQEATGQAMPPDKLAALALRLQRHGCANINFVSPTHVAHAVAEAIVRARHAGLTVPIVYNCGGYDAVETLRCLRGLVEIYMPDFKYADADFGRKYSDVDDYPRVATAALAEMYAQVGPLQVEGASGLATRGVLVRHLVLPNELAASRKVVDVVADTAPGTGINVMGQYHPAYHADDFAELSARPSHETVVSLRAYAESRGLVRVD